MLQWVNSGCVNANVGEGRSWVQVCNRDDQTWTVDSASITVEACLNQDTHCWVSAAVPGNYAHVNWGEDNCLYSEGPNRKKQLSNEYQFYANTATAVKLGCA